MTALPLLQALEATAVGTLVRESLYGFPILVGIHILGLVLSVGLLVWFDLRLLGLALQSAAVSRVYRRLIPWASVGFAVMFISGALLFTGYASAAYKNPFFWVKLSALLLAGLNAAFYHAVTERSGFDWDGDARPPGAARAAGGVSIALWAIVIMCGRLMAYTMY
ncbi:MAG TPA: DUF6644 family protein [Vicinamibacterales bacterium]|nr:DUF6644 family protein [Vicinamibacterales bacterium]